MAHENQINQPSRRPNRTGGMMAGGGAFAGLAALIGASCCVLPLVLVNLGVSTALVANLAFFARAQTYFMAGSVLLAAAALTAAFWNGRRPGKLMTFILALSVIFILGAYIMPFYEGRLLRWINFQ